MKASVLFEQGKPLSVEELDLEAPRAGRGRVGEILVEYFAARRPLQPAAPAPARTLPKKRERPGLVSGTRPSV